MSAWVVAPIVIPLFTAALMLLIGEGPFARWLRPALAVLSIVACGAVAVGLLLGIDAGTAPAAAAHAAAASAQADGATLQPAYATIQLHSPGNWPVPFGIVLLADRLSVLMLLLTAVVALAATVQSLARWHRAGVHFLPLVQLQLMGIHGVFLTADLFNFFVFVEILLAASYGLLLHGSGTQRVKTGLSYVAVNLLASSLLLIAIAILYGVTGSLNMADVASKLVLTAPGDRGLLQAGVAVFGVALLLKAGCWPLNFWLVPAYSAASAPVGGIFALLTKVGIYALLRLWTLLFPQDAGMAARFGADFIAWGGLLTIAFGAIGMLASYRMSRLASFSVIVSGGTILTVIGLGGPALTGAALYYLLGSAVATATMFLLVELVERVRGEDTRAQATIDEMVGTRHYFGVDHGSLRHSERLALDPFAPSRPVHAATLGSAPVGHADEQSAPEAGPSVAAEIVNLDESEAEVVGHPIARPYIRLGFAFMVCTVTLAGLPPLAGFIGKTVMLSALLGPTKDDATGSTRAWLLVAALILSGLCTLIGMARAGIRAFWARSSRAIPHMTVTEYAPIAALCFVIVLLTVQSAPVLRLTEAAARSLYSPQDYIEAVRTMRAVPPPVEPEP